MVMLMHHKCLNNQQITQWCFPVWIIFEYENRYCNTLPVLIIVLSIVNYAMVSIHFNGTWWVVYPHCQGANIPQTFGIYYLCMLNQNSKFKHNLNLGECMNITVRHLKIYLIWLIGLITLILKGGIWI